MNWTLSYARGYVSLRMFAEAEEELSRLTLEQRESAAALMVYAELYQETGRWADMVRATFALCEMEPNDAGRWIQYAYAMRRARSVEEARGVLLQGEFLHPTEPIIKFNLGCYASLLGEFREALEYLKKAIALAPACEEMARGDEDYAPLIKSGLWK